MKTKDKRFYKVKYSVEVGRFHRHNEGTVVRPGIRVSDDDFGLADDLLIISILRKPNGDIESMLPMSTDDQPDNLPLPETLDAVIEHLQHLKAEHYK